MKKNLQAILLAVMFSGTLFGQTQTLLDFESIETSTNFQYFESVLDGTMNNIIENPDPSGINTSAFVADFVHPADGQPWAGGFANPPIAGGISTIGASQMCVDVWFNEPGNLSIKLEDASGVASPWIITRDVADVQQWVNLCFDLAETSIEDPGLPAIGNEFDGLVMFFDFQTVPDADRTYYFDNLTVEYGGTSDAEVSLSVDMNSYAGDVDSVFVIGSFNDWQLEHPMEDNGNGVWSITATLPAGPQEYLFFVKEGAVAEQFSTTAECVRNTNGPNGEIFSNRLDVFSNGSSFDYCWSSCYACGESVNITFNLGFPNNVTAADSVYLAGGGNFEEPGGRFLMNDDDGDGIYTLTIQRGRGFSSFYTFGNGVCPDFSCKEDISGQDCADPDNFNDRFLEAMEDMVISTCFGECTVDTECTFVEITTVTLRVDMSNETIDPEGVFIAGTLNGWVPEPIMDVDGSGIYEAVFNLPNGVTEYKFLNGPNGWELFNDGDPCTVSFDDGNGNLFVNRFIDIDGSQDSIVEEYCFNSCAACTVSNDNLSVDNTLFQVHPKVSSGIFQFELGDIEVNSLVVHATNGVIVENLTAQLGDSSFDLGHLPAGMYYLKAENQKSFKITKLIIQ